MYGPWLLMACGLAWGQPGRLSDGQPGFLLEWAGPVLTGGGKNSRPRYGRGGLLFWQNRNGREMEERDLGQCGDVS